MLTLLAFLLALAFGTWALGRMPEHGVDPDLSILVEAIRMTENWDGRSRGAAGERGHWQITPAVWAQFTSEFAPESFDKADGRSGYCVALQRRVALAYLTWIRRRLLDVQMPPTPYFIALVWAAGFDSVFRKHPHRPSAAKRDYAERAENLYHELNEKHLKETTLSVPAR